MNDRELLKAISDLMDAKIQPMKGAVDDTKADIADMMAEMKDMRSDIEKLQAHVRDMKLDIRVLSERVEDLELVVRNLKTTLELETRRSIQAVAEGHLDLDRKLNEALKVEESKELLMIRVNFLESELKKLKDVFNQQFPDQMIA